MRNAVFESAGLLVLLGGVATFAAPPPGPKPTVGAVPPRVTTAPVLRQQIPLVAFSVGGTLKRDTTVPGATQPTWLMRYKGVITLTANVDLYDVEFQAIAWDDGKGGDLLGTCDFTAVGHPVLAGSKVNFTKGERREYLMTCVWPSGGPTTAYWPPPYHADLTARYYLANPPKSQEKSGSKYRIGFP